MDELTDELAQTALELIYEYGANIEFVGAQDGNYDPALGKIVKVDTAQDSFKALIEDLNGPSFNGNLVNNGDKKLTAAANYKTSSLNNSNKVNFGEGWYSVLGQPKAIRLGSTPIIYEIHITQ